MMIDHHDESYHFSINNADDQAQYNVSFLSNGVIQQISIRDTDPERYSGERKDGSALDDKTWMQAKSRITEWVEKVASFA